MSRIQNPAPDATRRRASTNRKMDVVMFGPAGCR